MMTTTDLRNGLGAALDAVIDDEEELVIPRDGGRAVGIVSLQEWNSMRETLHVLGNRTQTRRLLDSLDSLDAGDVVQYDADADEATAAA